MNPTTSSRWASIVSYFRVVCFLRANLDGRSSTRIRRRDDFRRRCKIFLEKKRIRSGVFSSPRSMPGKNRRGVELQFASCCSSACETRFLSFCFFFFFFRGFANQRFLSKVSNVSRQWNGSCETERSSRVTTTDERKFQIDTCVYRVGKRKDRDKTYR